MPLRTRSNNIGDRQLPLILLVSLCPSPAAGEWLRAVGTEVDETRGCYGVLDGCALLWLTGRRILAADRKDFPINVIKLAEFLISPQTEGLHSHGPSSQQRR